MRELVWTSSLLQSNDTNVPEHEFDTTGNTVSVPLCYSNYELQSQKNSKQEKLLEEYLCVFILSIYFKKFIFKNQVKEMSLKLIHRFKSRCYLL